LSRPFAAAVIFQSRGNESPLPKALTSQRTPQTVLCSRGNSDDLLLLECLDAIKRVKGSANDPVKEEKPVD
jgi:hypothetical protein